MQTRSPILDDLADIMTSAAGAVSGVGEEVKSALRTQADRFIADMDLVSREEFDALKALCQKLAADNEALHSKIDALEKKRDKRAPARRRTRKPAS